jgi:hypothetical protein
MKETMVNGAMKERALNGFAVSWRDCAVDYF